MKNNLSKFYITAFFLCSAFTIFAQPGTEDDTGTGNLEGADDLPIDNSIWFLVVLGLLFVFLKFRVMAQQRNTQKQ